MAVGGNSYDLSYSNQQRDEATSGDIKTGPIFNISSVGNIGTVKMLAIAGIAWLFIRMFKKGK